MHDHLRSATLSIAVSAVFTALIAVSAFLTIPLPSGVPVTLQTLAVALTGYCLGVKRAVPAVLAYILLGVVGAPVFSGFQSGPAVLMGKTGGFILGFLFLVFACALAGEWKNRALQIAAGLAGLLLCHLLGVLWFSFLTGTGFFAAAAAASLPFLLKDALCVAGAMLLSLKLRKATDRFIK